MHGPHLTPDAVVHIAGNAAIDVLVKTPEALPTEAGHTWGSNTALVSDPIEMTMGGGGAAPAYVLGRLGQSVSLNSNIGSDRPGELMRSWLSDAGVDLRVTARQPPASAVHIVHLDEEARRRSAYYPGEKVEWLPSLDTASPWLLTSGYGRVDAEDVDELEELFAAAHGRGTQIVFDPSPWFAGRVPRERMVALWTYLHGIVATEEELAHWVPDRSGEAMGEAVLAAGPDCVVIKRGPKGALYAAASGESGTVPTEAVSRSSSIGAGDTLNGRLLYGLSTGEDLTTAVTAAVSLATEVVRQGRGVLAAL